MRITPERFAQLLHEVKVQHPEEGHAQHIQRVNYRVNALHPHPLRKYLWPAAIAAFVLLAAVLSRCQTTNVNVDRFGGVKTDSSVGLPVNCLTGCAGGPGGGGLAQLQVRNALDSAWVNVGFNIANLTLPVTIQGGSIANTGFNVNNFPASQAVTGTFWQATQPVSGTFWQATQPVSGTFWQATQPVSNTQLPVALDGSGFLKVHEQGTATVSGTVTANIGTSGSLALDATLSGGGQKAQVWDSGASLAASVSVKGTQPTNSLGVQQPKDSGRTYVAITIDRVAAITTEALVTMTINKAGTVTTGTSYAVTAGKTLRIQSLWMAYRITSTTQHSGRVRLRAAASVLVSSPILATLEASSNSAVAENTQSAALVIPDGLEIAAAQQIGISQIGGATTDTYSVTLIGYEY